MGIDIPFPQGISLKIGEPLQDRKGYPTGRLQKGFILLDHGEQMAEEAVGFGVPVLKRGLQAIFPGDVSLTWQRTGSTWEVTALYQMNLVEKISRSNHENVGSKWVYRVKDILAESIRRFPPLRGLLTGISSLLRKVFNLKTIYVEGEFSTELKVTTTLDGSTGRMVVEIEAGGLPAEVTEVVVMNEQGAHFFDLLRGLRGEFAARSGDRLLGRGNRPGSLVRKQRQPGGIQAAAGGRRATFQGQGTDRIPAGVGGVRLFLSCLRPGDSGTR